MNAFKDIDVITVNGIKYVRYDERVNEYMTMGEFMELFFSYIEMNREERTAIRAFAIACEYAHSLVKKEKEKEKTE